ncbi:MAG: hypothetical protein LBO64_09205 [Desulfovibrio sp.]|jgi:hypothetical protein|nr:hypothetical protein [Desulfovibrio sp.]
MLNFNISDPEKPYYVDPDVLMLSKYWYLSNGNVIKAINLLEALQKAEKSYYMLGDHSGLRDVQCLTSLSGNILHIGFGLIEILSEFINTPFISHEQLAMDFYYKTANFWVIFPTSKDVYDKWKFHYEYAKNYPYAFLTYEIKNNSAIITADRYCRRCNACTTN